MVAWSGRADYQCAQMQKIRYLDMSKTSRRLHMTARIRAPYDRTGCRISVLEGKIMKHRVGFGSVVRIEC
jgi:hypothetical protein